MRAILIDSYNHKVEEINLSEVSEIYLRQINHALRCKSSTYIQAFDNGALLFFDADGLYTETNCAFRFSSQPVPIFGNALIIGWDKKSGTKISIAVPIEDISPMVLFSSKEETESLRIKAKLIKASFHK